MGWINTGYCRSLTVTITKTVCGVIQQGYPRTYYGQDPFPGYPTTLTDEELAQLSLWEFNNRLDDFKTYVEGIETSLEFDTDTTVEARIEGCPECTTTTTTEEVTTTTTTEEVTITTTTEEVTTTTTTEDITTTTTTGEVTTTTTTEVGTTTTTLAE